MKTLLKALFGVMVLMAIAMFTTSAQAQPRPSYWNRFTRDITGTNTVIPAAKTFTNIQGTAVASWKFNDVSIRVTGIADGTSSNAVIVFRKVLNEGDAPPRLLTAANHFNLYLVPDGTAGNTMDLLTNFPSSVPISDGYWQAWMATNGGCNWTNVTITEVGRTPSP